MYFFRSCKTSLTLPLALLAFALPLTGYAVNPNVTLTPGSGGSVILNDPSDTPQLQVDSNGVTLPNTGAGTATRGLCFNASNRVITCAASSGNGHVFMASTASASLTTIAGGLVGIVAVLPLSGYTETAYTTSLTGGLLDLTPSGGGAVPPPQTLVSDGTFSTLRATLFTKAALALVGTTVTISAQIYEQPGGFGTTLSPVAGTACVFAPALTGVIAAGTEATCSLTGLSIPYTAGSTAVIVLSATAAGVSLINTISISASVSVGG